MNDKITLDYLLGCNAHRFKKDDECWNGWMDDVNLILTHSRYHGKMVFAFCVFSEDIFGNGLIDDMMDPEEYVIEPLPEVLSSPDCFYPAASGQTASEALANLENKLNQYTIDQIRNYIIISSDANAILNMSSPPEGFDFLMLKEKDYHVVARKLKSLNILDNRFEENNL